MYACTGEPIIRIKKNTFFKRRQLLEIVETWQRIIDDKWIIGVVMKSSTTW